MVSRSSSRVSRRTFLALTAGGVFGSSLLAACGPNRPPSSAPAAPAKAESQPAAPAAATQAPAKPAAEQKPATEAKPAEAKPAAQAAPGQPGTAKQTVRYHGPAGNQGDIVEMRAKELMAEKPNLDIKLELYPSTEYLQKVQTLIAGNQLGDVFWAVSSAATYHQWAAKGILHPIDDLIKRDNLNPNDYFENAWKGQVVNGQMWGLTFKGHPGASLLFFNKDLFAKAGLPEPTDDMTLDQFLEASKKLTQGDVLGRRLEMEATPFLDGLSPAIAPPHFPHPEVSTDTRIVVVEWRIKTGRENEFLEHWSIRSTIPDRSGLIHEFLSRVESREQFPWRVWDLNAAWSTYINVGFWRSTADFQQQLGWLIDDTKPLLAFEAQPRQRMCLAPERWRIGHAPLLMTDHPAVR